MSAPPTPLDRLVVPRWRETAKLVRQDDAQALPIRSAASTALSDADVKEAYALWLEKPTIELASDVVINAATFGDNVPLAFGPAEQLIRERDNVAPALVELAGRVRNGRPSVGSTPPEPAKLTYEHLSQELHRARRSVHDYPRNPFAWLDLSLLHTRLGNSGAAERAARTSFGLAPENRLIVRSMARLLLHLDDKEQALRVLRNNPLTPFDPWLAAVEISLSDLAGRTPKFQRAAYDLVRRFEKHPGTVSELAASLGTNIAMHGNARKAKPYFRLALEHPTENVVAQASWISKKVPTAIEFDGSLLKQNSVFEGRALSAYHEGRWSDVLAEAELWLADESFSARPAVLGSFVAASMLGDYDRAESFARLGLIANPNDSALRNNLAYALACGDQPLKAAVVVSSFPTSTAQQTIFYIATAALLSMRTGQLEEGRAAYKRAIELADRLEPGQGMYARYHYALTELQTDAPDYDAVLSHLKECQRLKRRGGIDLSVVKTLEARIANLMFEPKRSAFTHRNDLLKLIADDGVA